MLCIARTMLSKDVCPFVCLLHTGIPSKRLNMSSKFEIFNNRAVSLRQLSFLSKLHILTNLRGKLPMMRKFVPLLDLIGSEACLLWWCLVGLQPTTARDETCCCCWLWWWCCEIDVSGRCVGRTPSSHLICTESARAPIPPAPATPCTAAADRSPSPPVPPQGRVTAVFSPPESKRLRPPVPSCTADPNSDHWSRRNVSCRSKNPYPTAAWSYPALVVVFPPTATEYGPDAAWSPTDEGYADCWRRYWSR